MYELSLPPVDPDRSYAARFYVDPASGLRLRQEMIIDGALDWARECEVLDASQVTVSLDHTELQQEALMRRDNRLAHLDEVPFPVWGLPDSYLGLHLEVLIPVADWEMIRLEYFPDGGSHAAHVIVSTYDLAGYPDYPQDALRPLASASAMTDSVGDVLRFGQEGVAIVLQVVRGQGDASIEEIARALVRLN
ncbi:MAG: hypothetical protein JW990_21440 [Thermoleophilia bacterium]|nr:hypothetical protein [Thermoleophilia bacterium]